MIPISHAPNLCIILCRHETVCDGENRIKWWRLLHPPSFLPLPRVGFTVKVILVAFLSLYMWCLEWRKAVTNSCRFRCSPANWIWTKAYAHMPRHRARGRRLPCRDHHGHSFHKIYVKFGFWSWNSVWCTDRNYNKREILSVIGRTK